MYYAHGGDSLNFSCGKEGHAVLIKSGFPAWNDPLMIGKMRQLNPSASKQADRPIERLCNGQTLFCKSLGLKVLEWDSKKLGLTKIHAFKLFEKLEIIGSFTFFPS